MRYLVCIDETGKFNYFDRPHNNYSSVGGCVLKQDPGYKDIFFDHLRDEILKNHNRDHAEEHQVLGITAVDNRYLHFSDLIVGSDNDKTWAYPVIYGKNLISSAVNEINKHLVLSCFTTGRPLYSMHQQHAYSGHLLTFVAGVCGELNKLITDEDTVEIYIAQRHGEVVEGEFERYHEELCRIVIDCIERNHLLKNKHVKCKYGDARRMALLQFADIILGFIRCDQFPPHDGMVIASFNVTDHYRLVINDHVTDYLKKLENKGYSDQAIGLTVDFISSSDNDVFQEGEKYLISVLKSNSIEEKVELLVKSIETKCEEFLLLRNERGSLLRLKRVCETVLKNLRNASDGRYLKLMERCLYYLIHFEAHAGFAVKSIGKSFASDYDQLMKDHGASMYPSLPERISKRYETKLISVQTFFFNSMLFDECVTFLEDDVKRYEQTVGALHKYEQYDDLGARLYGTLGQAKLFSGSMTNNESQIKDGIDYLLSDIDLIPPKTLFYNQGLSFIHSAYWMLDDETRCREYIGKLFGVSGDNESILSAIGTINLGDNPYLFLDFLRFSELQDRLHGCCGKYLGSDELTREIENRIETLNYPISYPFNLVLKWVSVMYARRRETDKAADLLSKYQNFDESTPLFVLHGIVFRMLKNILKGRSACDPGIRGRVGSLASEFEGVHIFMEKTGFPERQKTIEEVARVLPYYYS